MELPYCSNLSGRLFFHFLYIGYVFDKISARVVNSLVLLRGFLLYFCISATMQIETDWSLCKTFRRRSVESDTVGTDARKVEHGQKSSPFSRQSDTRIDDPQELKTAMMDNIVWRKLTTLARACSTK